MAYEYAGAARTIYMDKAPPNPVDSWMGHSVGHWEGDTLVVDVTRLNDQTWFDRVGNFHSDALHVVERYTPLSADALNYDVIIEERNEAYREVGGWRSRPGGVVPSNEFWYDRGNKVVGTRSTSLIVDPPNGRLPAMTPDGKKRADLRAAEQRETQLGRPHADSWEDRPLQERCIVGLNAGPPMHPGAYNNNFQLFQAPQYVVILNEMVHDARIIPLDGRPHGHIRQWKGDSRGHWEGNTLVVDTTNFKRETSLPNSTANTHLVERFTRTDANTLLYEFTVEDPTMWTRPWTAVVPMRKSEDLIYEYACHEGNYAMASILAGARAAEKAAEEAAKKGSK